MGSFTTPIFFVSKSHNNQVLPSTNSHSSQVLP